MILFTLLLGLLAWIAAQVLPGVTVSRRDTPPSRSADTDTGKWFVVGEADRGPLTPTEVDSLDQFISVFGKRQTYSVLYDALDAYFHEGGARAIVSRVIGPAKASASKNLLDGAAAIALVVTAKTPGDWGNNLTVQVTHPTGTTFQLVIAESGTTVETSPEFATTADAVAWTTSGYVTIAQGASTNDPAVAAAAALTGGSSDRLNITDAHWQIAIDVFTKDLGPGQVSYPGRTTNTAHAQLLLHAENNGRIAILDAADTATVATLTSAAATDRAAPGKRSGGLFAPWAVVPGIALGTTRLVPYSAIEAGIIARNDGQGNSPNDPAAGELGQSRYAIALSQAAWSDTDRGTLNDAGVNVARVIFGGVRTYGYRTLADPVTDDNWINLANGRYYMSAVARGGAIAEGYVFAQIDGKGRKVGEFQGALMGMLLEDYTVGSLFGATPEEAFLVDVSGNTPASLATGVLKATLEVKASPDAERVQLEIVKTRITEAI